MAKKLYDLGRDLPDNYVFTVDYIANRDDSFFLLAVELLTACEIEIIEDNGDDFTFHLALPEAIQWVEIESTHSEAVKDREWILSPLSEDRSGFEEQVSIKLEKNGLTVTVECIYHFNSLFEKMCDCFSRLQQKVTEWTKLTTER